MPTTTAEKMKHIKAIQDLSAILAGVQDRSMMHTSTHPATTHPLPAQRVAAPSTRVANAPPTRVATTSNKITAPHVIRTMPLVHQRHTRNNNPFHILSDDDDNDDTVSKPTARTKPKTYAIPIVEPDDEQDEIPTMRPASPPRRSTRLISSRTPCSISRQALYHIIGLGFTNAPANTVPTSLAQHHKQYTDPLIDIEEYCYGVVHPVTKETITHYRKLVKDPLLKELWLKAMSKKLHRLAQGCTGITKGTNTIFYLSHADICKIPQDRTVTYVRIVIDHRPQKEDPNCVRITVGGNLIDCPFELTTRTEDMVSSKILWNSVISTKDARFAGADIKNMYLETPLDRYEYMKMPNALFPADIIEYYKLMDKVLDGYVYMEIQKGMYGLPQAGVLANKLLKKHLARHGYFEQSHTPGLWKHVSRPIWFNLCVDDFGIKYVGREHLQHLYDAL
jgi:hypothetical protein